MWAAVDGKNARGICKYLTSLIVAVQVGSILHTLGWCLGDYVRGYMLQVNVRVPI